MDHTAFAVRVETTLLTPEQVKNCVDFDEFTRGYHEEWRGNHEWGPAYGYSNCPPCGLGNSMHHTKQNYDEWFMEALNIMRDGAFDLPPDDTCAFLRRTDAGPWELIEIIRIQPEGA